MAKSPNSKYWKKKADTAWANDIKQVGDCEICGSRTRRLNAHHIILRGRLKFRYDSSNGVCICSYHHTFDPDCCPHGGLDAVKRFEEWLMRERPGQYQWFLENKDDKGRPEFTYEEMYYKLKGK